MTILQANICVGLGDAIYTKGQLDPFKHLFEQIKITFDPGVLNTYRPNQPAYSVFLNQLGNLFFTEPPYLYNVGQFPLQNQISLCQIYGMPVVKPELKHILCKGYLLNLDEEYIVLNTKLRFFPKDFWRQIGKPFWDLVRLLSNRYKIVVIGERVVEQNREYRAHGPNLTYCIYNEIINNIPAHRLLDLTIPALGITAPNLRQIQQDCLIMSEAKVVILLGMGGAFCMGTSVANSVGYMPIMDDAATLLYGEQRHHPNAMITKDWGKFISELRKYL